MNNRQFPFTRAGTHCPMCLGLKDAGLVVHEGDCNQRTGFKDADPLALNVVEAYETYLVRLSRMVSEMRQGETA
jgi:hypothetical protein